MVPYVPPSKRGRQDVIAFYAVDLNDLLKDFNLPPLEVSFKDGHCLHEEFKNLADIVGIYDDVKEDVEAFDNVFFKKDTNYGKKQTQYYVADYNENDGQNKSATEVSKRMNAYFNKLSKEISMNRLSKMSEHPKLASFTIDRNVSTLIGVGSLQLATFVTKRMLITTMDDFNDAMKKEYRQKANIQNHYPIAESVSLTLFKRPTDSEPPTHILTFRSQKQKNRRELVGGGNLNMSLTITHEEQAQKKIYEETFGLASGLQGVGTYLIVEENRGMHITMQWLLQLMMVALSTPYLIFLKTYVVNFVLLLKTIHYRLYTQQ